MERFNQTVLYFSSKYDAKKMHARVEVRPKDINLGANVWKSMEEYEPPLKAEEGRKEVDLDPVFSEEEPELDWDEVYHRDVKQLPFQSAPKASASIDVPSQWKYSEPEEDLDDLYHP